MPEGLCQLCGQEGVLRNGHVWPAWAYRDYVSELNRGGRFLHVGDGKLDNHPERYYWFCPRCENETLGGLDRYASVLCRGIESAPDTPVSYDARLLQFAVSISWRTAKAFIERHATRVTPELRKACRHWKTYLLGRRRHVEPFSQHLFVVHDPSMERHHALGGNYFSKADFVFTQIGPLWIFGLVSRRNLSLKELKEWDQSKLSPSGGTIHRVTQWRVGKTITMKCMRFLCEFEEKLKTRCREIVSALGNRLA